MNRELVTFLKFEIEHITTERMDKLTKYHNLVLVAIDEDQIVFRVSRKW